MTYKYSICHPEKENIEYRNKPISGNERRCCMKISQTACANIVRNYAAFG